MKLILARTPRAGSKVFSLEKDSYVLKGYFQRFTSSDHVVLRPNPGLPEIKLKPEALWWDA